MPDRIIYPQPGGPIAIVTPVAMAGLESLHAEARRVVPAGRPYRLVDAADIPTDRTWRNAWIADFSSPDGLGEAA